LQKRNELILTSAGEGICGFDLQGRAIFVNPAAAKITGWKVDELMAKSEEVIFLSAKTKFSKGALRWPRMRRAIACRNRFFYRTDGATFPAEYVRTQIKENEKVVVAW